MTDLTEEAVQVPKACSNGAAAVVQHLGMGAWTPPDVPWQPQVRHHMPKDSCAALPVAHKHGLLCFSLVHSSGMVMQ
jgi:hypothetical protein